MLYTRKGDSGTSGLFGTKERFSKDSRIYETLGTLDELNSLLGMCRAKAAGAEDRSDVAMEIVRVQEALFIAQAELAGAAKAITQDHVDALEATIDRIEHVIENPHAFVIPGATELSALLDYTRAVCRRAERTAVGVLRERPLPSASGAYLNRLSSLLYVLARYTAKQEGRAELSPHYSI